MASHSDLKTSKFMIDGGAITTFSYTPANRLTLANAAGALTTYTNDAVGNRTAMAAVISGGVYTTIYDWNSAGMMTSADPASGPVTFTYNAEGQRAVKESGSGSDSVTGYLYDHNNLLAETSEVGGLINNLYTTTTDQEYGDLIDEDGGAATHLYDAQANTNALLDSMGNVLAQYKYYAFGNIASYSVDGSPWASLTTSEWNYLTGDQWTALTPMESGTTNMLTGGKKQAYLDQETTFFTMGMGNDRGRPVDAPTARFGSEDPIRQAGGDANLEKYVGNNPVNNRDPSGHDSAINWDLGVDYEKVYGDQVNDPDRIHDIEQNLFQRVRYHRHVYEKDEQDITTGRVNGYALHLAYLDRGQQTENIDYYEAQINLWDARLKILSQRAAKVAQQGPAGEYWTNGTLTARFIGVQTVQFGYRWNTSVDDSGNVSVTFDMLVKVTAPNAMLGELPTETTTVLDTLTVALPKGQRGRQIQLDLCKRFANRVEELEVLKGKSDEAQSLEDDAGLIPFFSGVDKLTHGHPFIGGLDIAVTAGKQIGGNK